MATPEERLAAFFDPDQPHEPFKDEQIDAVALLLARCSHENERSASKSPRTYIVFRMIEKCDLLPRVFSEGFGDGWFPVSARGLPGFLDPRVKVSVLQTQRYILTKSLDLENGQHCIYGSEERRPFEIQSYIGSGAFGQVRKVESRVTYKQYALKTVRRRQVFGSESKKTMSIFENEMNIMKTLRHKHVVRYVGSYTDKRDLGLLMSPVADYDLEAYLEEACENPKLHAILRTFFGCLATALEYLHDAGIKHRDIKPRNVLVHKANVLLSDFGISQSYSLDTTGGHTEISLRYCSPEMAAYAERNASADVWSLGCVFLEMQAALQGRDWKWVKAHYEAHGTGSTNYHANPEATNKLLEDWRATVKTSLTQPLAWIEQMLEMKRQDRPTAREIMIHITESEELAFAYSCEECCNPYDSTDSESTQESDTTKDRGGHQMKLTLISQHEQTHNTHHDTKRLAMEPPEFAGSTLANNMSRNDEVP